MAAIPAGAARLSASSTALLLFGVLVTEADDLATTLRVAALTGHGWHDERNPLAALAWAQYGPLGLVAFKIVMSLWVLLGLLLLRRLAASPAWVAAFGAFAICFYAALTLVHVWQIVHVPGYAPIAGLGF